LKGLKRLNTEVRFTSMIQIFNKKTYDGPGFYIGRPMPGLRGSILLSPFKITKYVGREESIDRYRDYFEERMETSSDFRATVKALAHIAVKDMLILICWCTPLNCHGSVIRDYIQYHTETLNGRWFKCQD